MEKQWMFITRMAPLGVLASLSFFASSASAACFDFEDRKDLRLPPPKYLYINDATGDAQNSGRKNDETFWASVQGDVEQPISELLGDLIIHRSTKSDRISELEIQKLESDRKYLHQKAKYTVRPFPFVSVEWTEDWLFADLKGSLRTPRQVLVSYEKTDGTHHIGHLCGNIELRQKSPRLTTVYIYEEVQATQRTQRDTLNGVLSIMSRLKSRSNTQTAKN